MNMKNPGNKNQKAQDGVYSSSSSAQPASDSSSQFDPGNESTPFSSSKPEEMSKQVVALVEGAVDALNSDSAEEALRLLKLANRLN